MVHRKQRIAVIGAGVVSQAWAKRRQVVATQLPTEHLIRP